MMGDVVGGDEIEEGDRGTLTRSRGGEPHLAFRGAWIHGPS